MRSRMALIAALAALCGCYRVERMAASRERADGMYREAMAEYAAGNLDKAIAKFEKVVVAAPGNASARFQLACLQHDSGRDLLAAVGNYREYIAQAPNDDKVTTAKQRLADCSKALAVALSKQYGLGGSVAQDEEIGRIRKDRDGLSAKLDALQKELDQLKLDYAAARRENDRIRRMVLAGGEDASAPERPSQAVASVSKESEVAEIDSAGVDRVKFSADVDKLIAEEKNENLTAPFGKTVRKPEQPKATPVEPPHEPRPATYVVQEGDTLYKLAVRFYGRRSAWGSIREANKAIISTDGRIKAGQVLRMP